MEQQFTDIFTVPRLPQLIFDQYYSSDSLNKLDKKQNGEYTFVRKRDAKGKHVYDEIKGDNLEEELYAFFKKITQKLAKHFEDVEIEKKDGNISIQYRPYILGEMNDWIDELLLYNLANYGEVLRPDEKGNDTTMPFPNFIHYTPSLFGKAFFRPLRKITVKLYGKRKQTQNQKQAIQQRQQIRLAGQKDNILSIDPVSVPNQNAPISGGKQMQMNLVNINAGKENQAQQDNNTSRDLLPQAQKSKQFLKNAQDNNFTPSNKVQGTNQQQTDDNKNMPQQQASKSQNNPVVVQKQDQSVFATTTQQQQKRQQQLEKDKEQTIKNSQLVVQNQYQSVFATTTQQQQKRQQQLQKDKEQTIKEIMTLLRGKINYYDEMKRMDKKKYPNYVNTSRNKKFNQSVRKILSEESLETLKIVKGKIERFQPQNNYPVNQRRLLTESLDKDKDVTIVALRNKLLGDPYKKLLFGDDFTKQQVREKNVSKLQNEYTKLSGKYQKERGEARLEKEIAQRKRLEELRENEQRGKRQAARMARQKEELDLQTRKNQLLEKGKRQTLQDPGEREELRNYYENNRHKIDGENEISSQQLISLYDEGQNLPVFLKQIKQQKEQKRKKAIELALRMRKCKEHSEKVDQLQKQIQTKSNKVNQLKNNVENHSKQVNQINQKIKKDSDQIKQLEKVIENLSTTREEQQQKRREFCKNNE